MQRMGALLDSIAWYDLVPSGLDGMRDLVVGDGGKVGDEDYVVASATRAGDTLVAYVPSTGVASRSIELDMAAMSGPARALWFNPTNGAYVDAGRGHPNQGRRTFTTPGDNGTGTNDWVLVLTLESRPALGTLAPVEASSSSGWGARSALAVPFLVFAYLAVRRVGRRPSHKGKVHELDDGHAT
jgi:hypothetical protein